MARNGSGVYSLPAGTAAVSGETISSTKWNQLTADIESDLNEDRPVVAGGTGASSAAAARINLEVLHDIADQTFTSGSGTYTPGSDVVGLIAFIVGGGGGGAGARTTSASNVCFGGGGGAGAVAIFFIGRDDLAASYSYSVGASGSGGSAGPGDAVGSRDGSDGGDTTFGSVTCTGGTGGTEVAESSSAVAYLGGDGGLATGGTLNLPGGDGSSGAISTAYGEIGAGGRGGSQMFGQGGEPRNGSVGQSARGRGGGGAGAFMLPDQSGTLNRSGGAGSDGLILILELKE